MSGVQASGVGASGEGGSPEVVSLSEAAGVRRATVVGNAVPALLAAGLVAEAAGWLLLGAGPLQKVLAWVGTGSLAVSLLAMVLVRAVSPVKKPVRAYEVAWNIGLSGIGWLRWRMVLGAVAFPALIAVVAAFSGLTPSLTGNGQQISAAGAEVVKATVIAVADAEKAGPGRSDGVKANYTVRLPGPESVGEGRKFRVHVRSPEYLRKGESLVVAYAPSKPGLGAVADEDRDEMERKLAGLGMSAQARFYTLAAWGVGTLVLLVYLLRQLGPFAGRRFAGASSLSAAPAQIVGHTPYRQASARKNGKPQTLNTVRMDCGGREVYFVPASGQADVAARALDGQDGRLEWNSAQQSDRLTRVDFVAPDGRRLLGSVPDGRLQPLAESAEKRQVGPAQELRKVVHLSAASYPLSLLPGAAAVMGGAVALHVPLITSTGEGDWRGALAIGGLFAIGISAAYSGYKATKQQ